MGDIKEIVIYPEEFSLMNKGVSNKIESKAKEQKGWFLGMLLGTLGASLLGNMLAAKVVIGAGEGAVRAGHGY